MKQFENNGAPAVEVYLGLGSNVGDRIAFLAEAIRHISQLPSTSLKKLSGVYETEPVGTIGQGEFLNASVMIETSLSAPVLYHKIKGIEKSVGRHATKRWGPREIDIDILLYSTLKYRDALLEIPHRELYKRNFVLEPLSELNGTLVHPVFNKSIAMLKAECTDHHAVRYSESFSKQLKLVFEECT